MPRFRPYVDAVQWTGTNVIEMRQFVSSASGAINSAVIRNGILYIEPAAAPGTPSFSIPVEVTGWVVIDVGLALSFTNTEFIARYEPDI